MNMFQKFICRIIGLDKLILESSAEHKLNIRLELRDMLDEKGEDNRSRRRFKEIVEGVVSELACDMLRTEARNAVTKIVSPESFLDQIVVRLKAKQLS